MVVNLYGFIHLTALNISLPTRILHISEARTDKLRTSQFRHINLILTLTPVYGYYFP